MMIESKVFFGICEVARNGGGMEHVVSDTGDDSYRITLRRPGLYRALACFWPFATMPRWLAGLALDAVKLGVGVEVASCR